MERERDKDGCKKKSRSVRVWHVRRGERLNECWGLKECGEFVMS